MGNVHCGKPGCCCRLLGRPPPPMICGARCYGCTKCCMMPPERHVLLLGRSGVGKTHVLYRALGASAPKPEPTKGFTSTIRYDESNTQSYEFYDVSGTEVERVFWRTLYTNVSFNDVVYFIDPLEYRAAKDKISEDRAELHALLSEPELQDAQIIVYFNWKKMVTDAKDAELKKEEKAQIEKDILQDLELTGFRDYVKEVIDPNVKVGASDVESEAARKQKTEEFSKMAIDKIRQKREAEAAAKAAAEGKAAAKDGAGAAKAADAEKKKAADAAKKAAADVTKLVPVPKMERAVVIPISSEDQLFCNLGLNVKAKAEKQDAEDELADLI